MTEQTRLPAAGAMAPSDFQVLAMPERRQAPALSETERARVIEAGLHDEEILQLLGSAGTTILNATAQAIDAAVTQALLDAADDLDDTTPASPRDIDIPEWLRARARGGAA